MIILIMFFNVWAPYVCPDGVEGKTYLLVLCKWLMILPKSNGIYLMLKSELKARLSNTFLYIHMPSSIFS